MFVFALTFVMFVGMSESSSISSYEPFIPPNEIPEMENNLEPMELTHRKAMQSNQILECDMEDIFRTVGLNELQDLVEAVSTRKGISPFSILRLLQKRIKNKEQLEENIINSMDDAYPPDFSSPPLMEIPPPIAIDAPSNRVPYSVPSNIPLKHNEEDDTKVIIIPVAPPGSNKFPLSMKAEMISRSGVPFITANGVSTSERVQNVLPAGIPMLSPFKVHHLRPPSIGATIRVNSGNAHNPINRDIVVTVSPFMTIIEALQQAEIKYQTVLGLDNDIDVINFAHSASVDCYLVSRINDVIASEDSGWKITIADRHGQVVYDDFCLPKEGDVSIKPGTVISLSYVPL